MDKRPSTEQEVQRLRQATREAHEALKDLRAAIREASALAPRLVGDFEALHLREMAQLSNHMQTEMNRQSAELNAAVQAARELILQQLTASEMVLDKSNDTVRLVFGPGKFNDRIPLPYPNHPEKESTP